MAKRPKRKAKRQTKGTELRPPKEKPRKRPKLEPRTRVQKPKPRKPKSKTKKSKSLTRKKSPHAASHSPKSKRKRRAPRLQSASVADRFAQAAQARYVADHVALGRDSQWGDRYKFYSDTEILARRALVADIYARSQTGRPVSEAEMDWFNGYANPRTGRVSKHFSRLRWEDVVDGTIRRRLVEAYETGGDEALADHAARVATEWKVPLREVYTLFWSG